MKKIDPVCVAILFAPIALTVALFALVAILDRSTPQPADPGFTASIDR